MVKEKGPKLHEILAVETSVKGKLTKITEETSKVFKTKQTHFDGYIKSYEPKEEDGERLLTDRKELITTVGSKLNHLVKFAVDAMTVTLQKEETNSSGRANAELIIGDLNYGNYSATSLLSMEHSFSNLRQILIDSPTLDMALPWETTENAGIYKLPTMVKDQMSQEDDFVVTVQATEKFPAQVVKTVRKFKIGTWTTATSSGKWTPSEKSGTLDRLDKVITAVKSAKSRANNVVIEKIDSPKTIFTYILGE